MSSASGSTNPFVRSIALVLAVARRKRFRAALIGGFALPFHGVRRSTGDVDFLVDASGSVALHDALLAAGARCLHQSADAANYAPGRSRLCRWTSSSAVASAPGTCLGGRGRGS